eukprot:CAMPEP_0113887300 /NCGR_PEP_ID=MMETSP0780_2-20120614/12126_1 /TAXON_ID=652834 /ORGANISM="Palpitomonas bilix" /LENGTH=127 /DNA_ID=CAMNT_0000875795 /DNA_START=69 /DNA_END=449 /DNA_ORIENTATION=- /assembly_acc=CAM_ASM_000599
MSERDLNQLQVSVGPSLNNLPTADHLSPIVRRPQTRSHNGAIKVARAVSMLGLCLAVVVLGIATAGLALALQEGENLRHANMQQQQNSATLNSSIQLEVTSRKAAIESEASSRMESHQQLNSSLQVE